MRRPPRFREAFVGYHYLLAGAVTAFYGLIVYFTDHALIGGLTPSTRSSLYVSLAATTGVLLGFGITAVTVFLSLGSGRGLDLARNQDAYRYVRTILMGAIYAYGIATLVVTATIVFDTARDARRWLEIVVVLVVSLAMFRTWALLWLLNRLLRLSLTDARA